MQKWHGTRETSRKIRRETSQTGNFEKTDVWNKASAESGTQQWHKEQTPEAAATKQEDIRQDRQENHWLGDHEANGRVSRQIAKDQKLDTVDGSTSSKAEKKATHRVRAGDVGAPATLDNFAPTIGMETDRKGFMLGHLD
jgi:hypothetical protein